MLFLSYVVFLYNHLTVPFSIIFLSYIHIVYFMRSDMYVFSIEEYNRNLMKNNVSIKRRPVRSYKQVTDAVIRKPKVSFTGIKPHFRWNIVDDRKCVMGLPIVARTDLRTPGNAFGFANPQTGGD